MILFILLTRTILRRFQEELHSCFLHAGDDTVTILLKNGLFMPFFSFIFAFMSRRPHEKKSPTGWETFFVRIRIAAYLKALEVPRPFFFASLKMTQRRNGIALYMWIMLLYEESVDDLYKEI